MSCEPIGARIISDHSDKVHIGEMRTRRTLCVKNRLKVREDLLIEF